MEKWDLVLVLKKFLWFFAGVVVAGSQNYVTFCGDVVRRLRLPRRDFESTMRSPTVARTNGILSVNEPRIDSRQQQLFEFESDRFPFFTVELRAACEQPYTPFLRYAAETAGRIDCCTSFPSCLHFFEKGEQVRYVQVCIMYCVIASLVDHEMSPLTSLLHIATAPEGRIQTKHQNNKSWCWKKNQNAPRPS